MKLSFALLADAVSISADGRFSIIGGDVGILWAPNFPATHPVLGFVAKIAFDPNEYGERYTLRFEVVAPDGQTIASAISAENLVPSQNETYPEIAPAAGFALNLPALTFQVPGRYEFRLVANFRESETVLGFVPLHVLPQSRGVSQSGATDGGNTQ